MCSQRTMENYQGDLTDILRASGTQTAAEAAATAALQDWQFPSNHPLIYPADPGDDFGDPFSHHLRDPLLHGTIDNAPTGFFHSSDISIKSIGADEMKRPNNMFSRMLQIAPNAKLPLPPSPSLCDSPAAVLTNDHALISPSSAKGCLMESSAAAAALQISSPRNTGIRRRKSQAKKVVCIPAPAPANSRSSGEIVPSDLWAWRKYGQKPIKGSPYPRGYYRCSSSKGCSARKQVERSRTDPNMLVITYTSEHNHPWPTQRNALAGSTRSQPSKNATTPAKSSTSSSSNSHKCKEEQKEIATEEEENALARPPPPSSSSSTVIKEENMEQDHFDNAEFDDQGFPHSYKPTLPPDNISHSEDSFFADLGEIDGDDPLDILLTQGFSGDDGRDGGKGLDPFSFYDWAAGNTATTRDSPPPPPPPPTTTAAAASKNDSS